MSIRGSLALSLLAGLLPAQTTWIVDANGGGNFTDLPPAVAAAQAGDLVLIRPGTYSSATVSKGIRIIGTTGVMVGSANLPMLTIDRVPANETFVVRGIVGRNLIPQTGIRVQDCLGHVHIEGSIGRTCSVLRSRQVSLHGLMVLTGSPSVHVEDSNVLLVQCTIQAWLSVTSPSHALTVERSSVVFAEGMATGGLNYSGVGPGSGIELRSGSLIVAGGSSTRISAGYSVVGPVPPTPAIKTVTGTLLIDPQVTLAPMFGGQPISGGASVTTRPVPSLWATVSGGVLSTTSRANPGDVVHLLVGPTLQPSRSLPLGELWLGLSHVVLSSVTMPAGGTHSLNVPLPPLPAGVVVTLQTLVVAGGSVQLSTPVAATLDG